MSCTQDIKLILIVEDEVPIADLLQNMLEDEGYNVAVAGNGKEALAWLERMKPHLVLSDVMMPILDGRDLCRAMQADTCYRQIPLVFMSAADQKHLDDCSYAAFINKPFSIDRLLNTVEQCMSTDLN